jgi:hypothetical protein
MISAVQDQSVASLLNAMSLALPEAIIAVW